MNLTGAALHGRLRGEMRWRASLIAVLALLVGGCAQNGNEAAILGKQAYLAECIVCHHNDPAKDGPLGPAIKGSSQELLEAKVLRGTYPPGYTPKRTSGVMPSLPKLAPRIANLAAYLR